MVIFLDFESIHELCMDGKQPAVDCILLCRSTLGEPHNTHSGGLLALVNGFTQAKWPKLKIMLIIWDFTIFYFTIYIYIGLLASYFLCHSFANLY